MNLDAPTELPKGVTHLSHTSVNLFLQCPEKWRRRYIANEYEPPVGIQLLGRAVHAAEQASYSTQISTGIVHPIEQVLDDFSTSLELEAKTSPGVDWQDDDPGALKDRGVSMLTGYHRDIVPAIRAEKVETKFEIRLMPEYKWTINGYIDLLATYDNGFQQLPLGPADIKTVKRKGNQDDLDNSPQATLYTYATDSEVFAIHELKDRECRVAVTRRDKEGQLRYLARVASVARQIDRCMETGDWPGAAPAAWWCREKSCGFYMTCPLANRHA